MPIGGSNVAKHMAFVYAGSATIALNALTCVMDVIFRLAQRNADMMLLRLMYGRRAAQVGTQRYLLACL